MSPWMSAFPMTWLAHARASNTWVYTCSTLDMLFSTGSAQSMVMRTIDGAAGPLTDRVCVFVHHDRRGRIWDHTRHYLQALRAERFSILFVSNAGRLTEEAQQFAVEHCAQILLRHNRGYDFGAYRDGITYLGKRIAELSLLIVANDSVYGPIAPLKGIFARMDFEKADVWALTDSWQHRYHAQSYFLVFGPAALRHPAFTKFWSTLPNLRLKQSVIRWGEIALTQHLLAAGLRVEAAWSYADLMDGLMSRGEPDEDTDPGDTATFHRAKRGRTLRFSLNPTHELWRELLRNGFPFIKSELLRNNPAHMEDLFSWHTIAKQADARMYEAITAHLKQTTRRGVAP